MKILPQEQHSENTKYHPGNDPYKQVRSPPTEPNQIQAYVFSFIYKQQITSSNPFSARQKCILNHSNYKSHDQLPKTRGCSRPKCMAVLAIWRLVSQPVNSGNETERILVFCETDNVASYMAQALEVLGRLALEYCIVCSFENRCESSRHWGEG